MTTNDDVVKKIFTQFDVLMGKNLEMINKRFKNLDKPEEPKQKGTRVAPVRNPFDGNI